MYIRRIFASSLIAALMATAAPAQTPAFVLDDGSAGDIQPPAPRAQVALNAADKADLEALILDTLTQNPDILVQALQLINAQQVEVRNAIAARDAHIREVADNAIGAPVTGNPDGDVSIVVFTDYDCTECRAANTALEEVVQSDGNIRVIHRPMAMMGPESAQAAKAAIAANKQGKFAAFNTALMGTEGAITTQNVLKAALDSDIDLNTLLVEQDAADVVALMDDTRSISVDFGFKGVPAFFIGTLVATGQPSASDLRTAIAQERERNAGSTAE